MRIGNKALIVILLGSRSTVLMMVTFWVLPIFTSICGEFYTTDVQSSTHFGIHWLLVAYTRAKSKR
jgi:hypothetical protein